MFFTSWLVHEQYHGTSQKKAKRAKLLRQTHAQFYQGMFGNCFHFLFIFLVFKGKRKKQFFCFCFCFQNEKHIWLVVLENTFFKNEIQEIFLVVVFEKVEFFFLWLIFKKKNYIYSNSKTFAPKYLKSLHLKKL